MNKPSLWNSVCTPRKVQDATRRIRMGTHLRAGLGRLELLAQFIQRVADDKSHTSPASSRLEHHRQTDLRSEPDRIVHIPQQALRARHERDVHLQRQLARAMLQAHRLDRLWAGTKPSDARIDDHLRKGRVLGQEAVPRVHERHPALLAYRDEGCSVRVPTRVRHGVLVVGAQRDRLVRENDVRRRRVGARVHCDSTDLQPLRRAQDAHRDLAAVRDEQLVRRVGRRIRWGVRGRHREGRRSAVQQLELGGAPRELPGVKYDFMRSCEAIA